MQHAEEEMENVFRDSDPLATICITIFYLLLIIVDILGTVSGSFARCSRATQSIRHDSGNNKHYGRTNVFLERKKRAQYSVSYLTAASVNSFSLPPNFVTICLAKRWAAALNGYNPNKCFRRNRFQNEKRQTENPIAWQTGQWSMSEMLDMWNIYVFYSIVRVILCII